MNDFVKAAAALDTPEILERLFFPRHELVGDQGPANGSPYAIEVAENITISCRFYPVADDGPSILYFHGNGEIAVDYDYVAPVYMERGINLFVADYRGYGRSGGKPTCAALIADSHALFDGFLALLKDLGYAEYCFVMGRSLGSAAAIEVAYHYQEMLMGLIVESGFSNQINQLERIGATHLFKEPEKVVGFGNNVKIREVRLPTLIIHGEEDTIIPASEGKALYSLSGAAHKKSLFIPGAGHNDLMEVALDRYMGAVASFVAQPSAP
jgi:alpha-beta hydrolase superfamily lysophospholipase